MKDSNRQIALILKRLGDIFIATIGVLTLAPLMIVIAAAIKLDSPGPIIFRQQRIGLHGRLFWIHKFRSMVTDADRDGGVTRLADPRVTRLGRLLRLSSLDEIPQLFNVIAGEMSLVGPRPLLPGTVHFSENRRHDMRPGCTGLPVISGRQSLDWEERMRLDLWYVDHWSPWLDLRILLRTIPVALSRKHVYNAQGQMPSRPDAPAD